MLVNTPVGQHSDKAWEQLQLVYEHHPALIAQTGTFKQHPESKRTAVLPLVFFHSTTNSIPKSSRGNNPRRNNQRHQTESPHVSQASAILKLQPIGRSGMTLSIRLNGRIWRERACSTLISSVSKRFDPPSPPQACDGGPPLNLRRAASSLSSVQYHLCAPTSS